MIRRVEGGYIYCTIYYKNMLYEKGVAGPCQQAVSMVDFYW